MSNSTIAKPLTLKCGLTLPNRLVKAAMAENWADKEALPTEELHAPYGEWADGEWGLVMTGMLQAVWDCPLRQEAYRVINHRQRGSRSQISWITKGRRVQ